MSELCNSIMVIDSPTGPIMLRAIDAYLTYCGWTEDPVYSNDDNSVLKETARQLQQYFEGKRTVFDLPLKWQGTSFQQAVWRGLCAIPYGETRSYQQLAIAIGHVNAYRAVGSANGQNRLAIIVPCHRVILASGELGGFTSGLEHKRQLLALERTYVEARISATTG